MQLSVIKIKRKREEEEEEEEPRLNMPSSCNASSRNSFRLISNFVPDHNGDSVELVPSILNNLLRITMHEIWMRFIATFHEASVRGHRTRAKNIFHEVSFHDV